MDASVRAHMREYARCGVPGARWKAAEGKGREGVVAWVQRWDN